MSIERVGKSIREIRTKMGLSQEEFGDLIGKSKSQVGAYENGTTDIPVSSIFLIAQKTGASIMYLMTGSDGKEEQKEYDASLRIYNLEDRLTVIQILAKNGYDVGVHKQKRTETGKTLDYFVHATDLGEDAVVSK